MDLTRRVQTEVITESRAVFVTRTYIHLFLAIVTFTLIEVFLFQWGLAQPNASAMMSVSWLLVLGAFMIVGWFASRTAYSAESLSSQYIGLAVYVVAQAIIFVPLLYIADRVAPGVISRAAQVTLLGAAGLTLIAFHTRKDFSFLRAFLKWGGICALLLIVASILFGASLGTWFSVGMIAFAGAAILYDTSNVIHHFPEDRYVGAALQLFASVALMFWYVLQFFMAGGDE
ncbi:MAG: permease [Candidatus Omnitrophota bacterium]|jgi:FtsH-binding integral membrane protein|nr:MAG: permease [Candidatus Omnitrophota bacterium]